MASCQRAKHHKIKISNIYGGKLSYFSYNKLQIILLNVEYFFRKKLEKALRKNKKQIKKIKNETS